MIGRHAIAVFSTNATGLTDHSVASPRTIGNLPLYILKGLLLACLLFVNGCSAYKDPVLDTKGGCAPTSSPFLPPDTTVDGRITYCEGGDGWTGTIESQPYPPGTRNVEVMLTGYPNTPGVTISAVANAGNATFTLFPPQPRERWQRVMLEIPPHVSQTGFRIRIEDRSVDHFGWAGVGASNVSPANAFANGLLPMLAAVLLGNTWLIAVCLCFSGAGHPRDRLLQGLLAGSCAWLLIFIGYVVSPKLGGVMASLFLILPFPAALLLAWRRHRLLNELAGMQKALLPVLMFAGLTLWVGLFPFHWDGQPNGDPAIRWSHLSTDAWLPLLFGDMLARGKIDVPMVGDWLSSDRPPLQVGLYLMLYKVFPETRALVYQGISTWAQALVLLPLASLLARLVNTRAQAIALLVLCLSASMLINTLFVWPKLFAAAFSLIYYLALFPGERMPRRWGQAGIAAAMALLAHGGALFFLIGASLVHLAFYRRQSLAMLVRAGSIAFVLYLPWIAYQRLVDPPGDRLLKWHFAGKIPVSDESAMHAIASAYSQLTPAAWISGRMQNFSAIFKGALSSSYESMRTIAQQDPAIASRFIDDDFFYTFHSMWFSTPLLLLPCLVLIYLRSRRSRHPDPTFKDMLQMAATIILTIFIWVTALFEGGTTTIHTGAYACTLLLQLVVLAAAWRSSAYLFYPICAANIVVALFIYILDRHFLPDLQAVYLLGTLFLCGGLLFAAFVSTRECSDSRSIDLPT
jgi:hypothetical protein